MSKVRRCLHEARVSADLTDSGRLFHAFMVDGRKESAFVREFANMQKLLVCASVWQSNPRAIEGGLSPVRPQNMQ